MPSWRRVRRRHVAAPPLVTEPPLESQHKEIEKTPPSVKAKSKIFEAAKENPTAALSSQLGANCIEGRKRQRGRKRKLAATDEKECQSETQISRIKTRKTKARPKEMEEPHDDMPVKVQAEVAASLPASQIDLKPLTQAQLSSTSVTGDGADSTQMKRWTSLEDIKLKGRWPPLLLAFMAKFKCFKEPTPIQSQCWPVVSNGRDLIGISKTGSGKTFAYVLPCLAHIMSTKSKSVNFGPYAVVLAPTRELAMQIEKETKSLCRAANLKAVCLYGGASKAEQIKILDGGADLIIATPGRLQDFACTPDKFTGRTILSLSMVAYLVLDEADSMLDLGFEPQVRKIFGYISQQRQMLLFSATWPKKIQMLAKEFLKNPITVQIGSCDSGASTGNQDVEQRILLLEIGHSGEADRTAKKEQLWRILSDHDGELCLVFCSMKKTAAVIAHQLREDGFKAKGLHGDVPQAERIEVLRSFREQDTKILVATDVAARGLDVRGISVVVNYDPAATRDDHVHRIGRTGRAGKRGLAYTLLGFEDVQQAKYLVEVFRSAGQVVPRDVAELASRRLENAKSRKCATLRAKKKAMRQDKKH